MACSGPGGEWMAAVEVSQLAAVVRNAAESVDAHSVMEYVGGYRRRHDYCSTVAVLVSSPYGTVGLLARIVRKLRAWKFLPPASNKDLADGEKLTVNLPPASLEQFPEDRFEGRCLFRYTQPQACKWRSLSIVVCLPQYWPFSLLYHTGPLRFYQKLQDYALALNYSLTHEGLERLDCEPAARRPTILSESHIFAALSLPYLPPSRRLDSVKFPRPPSAEPGWSDSDDTVSDHDNDDEQLAD